MLPNINTPVEAHPLSVTSVNYQRTASLEFTADYSASFRLLPLLLLKESHVPDVVVHQNGQFPIELQAFGVPLLQVLPGFVHSLLQHLCTKGLLHGGLPDRRGVF